jgi:hypothetical protein
MKTVMRRNGGGNSVTAPGRFRIFIVRQKQLKIFVTGVLIRLTKFHVEKSMLLAMMAQLSLESLVSIFMMSLSLAMVKNIKLTSQDRSQWFSRNF